MGRSDYEYAYYALKKAWEIEQSDTVYKYIKEFRSVINHVVGAQEIVKRAYLITARDVFDDFMIYLEWDRPLAQQYWLPRRKKLLPVAQALQDLENGNLDELFLSMPPRVGKTTLVLFFVLWIILRDSERSNLYCSYTDSVVTVFYKGLLEILNDPITYLWREIFPECSVASTNAKDLLLNINREKRYASFTGRSLYGTLNGACDCNGYEIADDLISGIEEAMNKDRLQAAWSKVENNYLPRGKETAKHLWIGTRWSLIDPQGMRVELLQNEPKFATVRWKQINVPALNENDESNFDYAFDVGFSTEAYQQRRASFERNNDMASWYAQYQGKPIERDGAVFSPEDLRFFNGVLPEADPDRIFMAVDPAWGGGDFVAAPVCYQYDMDIYVLDVVYDNSDKKTTQPHIVDTAIRHNVQAIRVEATKMTAEYADGIDEELKAKGHRVNVEKTTKHYTGNGKQQRIFDKAPDIREHMIFLEEGKRSKEYELFMQNVYSFSINGKNKHDDAPDSLAMAVNMAFFGGNELKIVKRMF
jgi:predicted phage terminase large subunit-like protein